MPSKKMKSYYGDIEVLERRRIRIDLVTDQKPTKELLLKHLNNTPADWGECGVHDITDEETFEYVEVLSFKELGKGEVLNEEERYVEPRTT